VACDLGMPMTTETNGTAMVMAAGAKSRSFFLIIFGHLGSAKILLCRNSVSKQDLGRRSSTSMGGLPCGSEEPFPEGRTVVFSALP
jgi:hypothetical protein